MHNGMDVQPAKARGYPAVPRGGASMGSQDLPGSEDCSGHLDGPRQLPG